MKNSGKGHKKKVHKAAKIYRQEIGDIRTLREDIIDYGTLSDYTLCRIANLENSDESHRKKSIEEISALKKELEEDYLQREKTTKRFFKRDYHCSRESKTIMALYHPTI